MVVSPMAVGSTKWSRPASIFLSCSIASRIWATGTSAMAGSGARRPVRRARRSLVQRAAAPDQTGERLLVAPAQGAARERDLGRHEHPVRHRLAVAISPVLGDR